MPSAQKMPPAITVAVTTGYEAEAARMTLAAIASQTISDRIELLFCTNPGVDTSSVQHLLEAVGSYRVYADAPIDTVDRCTARLVLQASAPLVAMIEDHAFPEPEWAEKVIETAEKTGAEGIGSGMVNANPNALLSWGNFIHAYAQWSYANPEGFIDWISHHNGSFRLAALQRLGADTVIEGCNREGDVVRKLKEAGGKLFFQPACRVRHVNPSKLISTFSHRFDVGRLYAANRVTNEHWGWPRRVGYVVFGWAIPIVRYFRMRKTVFRQLPEINEKRHGIAMLTVLVFDALGQMAGYLAGSGNERARIVRFEMDRAKHLTRADRKALYPTVK